jgi:hypothetical protein
MKKLFYFLFISFTLNAQVIFSDSFEGTWSPSTNGTAPSGWEQIATGTNSSIYWEKAVWSGSWSPLGSGTYKPTGAYDGSAVAHFNDYNCSSGNTRRLITPQIDLSSTSSKRLSFYHYYYSGSAIVKVYASSDGGSTFNQIGSNVTTSTSWTKKTFDIPLAYNVNNAKFALEVNAAYSFNDVWIDKFEISVVNNNDIKVNSVQLYTGNQVAGNEQTFRVNVSNEGLNNLSNITINLKVGTNTVNSGTIASLNADQTTNIDIPWTPTVGGIFTVTAESQADDNNSNNTANTNVTIFPAGTTAEGFENITFPPTGWSASTKYSRNTTIYRPGGNASAQCYSSSSFTDEKIYKNVTLQGGSGLIQFYNYGSGSNKVLYSTDNGTNWTQIGSTFNAVYSWNLCSVDLSPLAAGNYLIAIGASGNSYQSNYIDDVIIIDGPLPVELSSFNYRYINSKIELTWITKSEVNSNRFEVEKLVSGKWLKVGEVTAAGNSNVEHKYSFEDNNITSNSSYRLKIVDNDGSYKYSNTLVLENIRPMQYELKQNYPNPFNPTTVINYGIPQSSKVILKVYNIAGQEVMKLYEGEQEAGYYSINFNGNSLTSGIYIYSLEAGNVKISKKMMLVK